MKKTIELIRNKGYEFGNADCTICAEAPKLNPHIPNMQNILSEVINTETDNISIKATTSEKVGFVGRLEGISAYATVLIYKT